MPASQGAFLETKEYRRFAEFCDACRQHRYIGLCHGFPGVGKTLSAWQYAQWQLIQPYFPARFYAEYRLTYIERVIAETIATNRVPLPPELGKYQSILYTPPVVNTPKRVEQEIQALRLALSYLVDTVQYGVPQKSSEELAPHRVVPDPTALIIIDEADRLKTATLGKIQQTDENSHRAYFLPNNPRQEPILRLILLSFQILVL